MPPWLSELFARTESFIPHGHCYLWIPSLLWLHVISDALIGTAYMGISLILYWVVRTLRLPFSPVFVAFGLFIGLCGITHFMSVWTVWNPDYWVDGLIKGATAAASVATAIGLYFVRPHVEEVVHTARLSEERRIQLETKNAELEALYRKVKEQDELKSQFFANISHELRTPLALILGPAERMLSDSNLNEQQRRQLRTISRNGKSLLKQVNDLLDVAKLAEDRMQIHYFRMDMAPWFRRIASQFEIAAEQRSIDYQIDAPDSLPVEVDPDMLERVFINLLSNAFKFTPDDGAIRARISLDCPSAHGARDAGAFCFEVEDSGPGISPEQAERVFERFRQADGGATRLHGGSGLGLAIAKDFVNLHGGTIQLSRSALGGARLQVIMPRTAPDSAKVSEAPPILGSMAQLGLDATLDELAPKNQEKRELTQIKGRPSVLVVEDTPEMNDFVAGVLSHDYNVITACDGEEGLDKVLALRPDLVVTDVMMPRMSGDQLVAALRSRPDLDVIPILLLTAKADDDLKMKLLECGAQDYLTKPFLPRELLARAANLIALKRAGDTLRGQLVSASSNIEELAKALALRHRQMEAALEATEVAREQAERASQVKSQFLAMISHEMRTPLSTIQLNAQLLERQAHQRGSVSFSPQLQRTVRATQQLGTVIEGLLEYARMDGGRLAIHPEPVDVLALAREAVELGKLVAQSSEVELSLAPVEHNPRLNTDRRLLRVILNNLVSNALKFTQRGRITLRILRQGDACVFEVEDTGIGIAPEDLNRIFEPFEQLEPVKRKSIPGVGLGLSLIREIVLLLGGKVEVESEKGAGSTFRVFLPDKPEQERPAVSNEKSDHGL